MTRLLVVAASLGLMISSAGACAFKNSVEAKVDQTVVASVVTDEVQGPMSTPDTAADVDQAASADIVSE